MKRTAKKALSVLMVLFMLLPAVPTVFDGEGTEVVAASEVLYVNTLKGLKSALETEGEIEVHLSGEGDTLDLEDEVDPTRLGSFSFNYINLAKGKKTLVLDSYFVVEIKNSYYRTEKDYSRFFSGLISMINGTELVIKGDGGLVAHSDISAYKVFGQDASRNEFYMVQNYIFDIFGGKLTIESGIIGGAREYVDTERDDGNYFGAIHVNNGGEITINGGKLVGTAVGEDASGFASVQQIYGEHAIVKFENYLAYQPKFTVNGGTFALYYLKNEDTDNYEESDVGLINWIKIVDDGLTGTENAPIIKINAAEFSYVPVPNSSNSIAGLPEYNELLEAGYDWFATDEYLYSNTERTDWDQNHAFGFRIVNLDDFVRTALGFKDQSPEMPEGKKTTGLEMYMGESLISEHSKCLVPEWLKERGYSLTLETIMYLNDNLVYSEKNGNSVDLKDYATEKGTLHLVHVLRLSSNKTGKSGVYTNSFSIKVKDPDELKRVDLNVARPVVGANPGKVSAPAKHFYEVYLPHQWWTTSAGSLVDEDDVFEKGKTYVCFVMLRASGEHSFTPETQVFIAGKEAKIKNFGEKELSLEVEWEIGDYYVDIKDFSFPKVGDRLDSTPINYVMDENLDDNSIGSSWSSGSAKVDTFIPGISYSVVFAIHVNDEIGDGQNVKVTVNGDDEVFVFYDDLSSSLVISYFFSYNYIDVTDFEYPKAGDKLSDYTKTFDYDTSLGIKSASLTWIHSTGKYDTFVPGELYLADLQFETEYALSKVERELIGFTLNGEELTPYVDETKVAINITLIVSEEPERETGLLGDVNLDEWVDSLDAALILQYDAGLIELSAEQLDLADVDKDGWVDSIDAAMILKYDAGIIEKL